MVLKKTLLPLTVALIILTLLGLLVGCGGQITSRAPATVLKAEQQQEVDWFDDLVKVSEEFIKKGLQVMQPWEAYESLVLKPDPGYYIIDLRSRLDFMKGSILGAVNIPYETSWQDEQIMKIPVDKKIVLVCEDGAKSAQTAVMLGMKGYDVTILLYGMAGWNPPKVEDCPVINNEIETSETLAVNKYPLPSITTGNMNAGLDGVLTAQNQKIFSAGTDGYIAVEELQGSLSGEGEAKYFLVDLRRSEHYLKGHIPGAINIPYEEILQTANLEKLPAGMPDTKIVLVCYTGFKANQAARILNQLGYQAVPLQLGMSGWTKDKEVIGILPEECYWRSCYGDASQEGVSSTSCSKGYPTIVTRLQNLGGGG